MIWNIVQQKSYTFGSIRLHNTKLLGGWTTGVSEVAEGWAYIAGQLLELLNTNPQFVWDKVFCAARPDCGFVYIFPGATDMRDTIVDFGIYIPIANEEYFKLPDSEVDVNLFELEHDHLMRRIFLLLAKAAEVPAARLALDEVRHQHPFDLLFVEYDDKTTAIPLRI